MPNKNIVVRSELNRVRCFEPLVQSTLSTVWNEYKAADNWTEQLAQLILHYAQDKEHSLQWIQSKLITHLNDKKYHSLQEFTVLLQRMNALLGGEISDPSIPFNSEVNGQSLAIKLIEGMALCLDGFHNRLNSTWMSWLNSMSVDNFANNLEKIRNDLAQGVAQYFSDDVHDQNDVSKIAAPLVDTKPINPNDIYHSINWDFINNPTIIEQLLIDSFENQYTPLLIIKGIEEQIFSYLNFMAAYTSHDSTGLVTAIYEKSTQELDTIFPTNVAETRGDRYWLITNEASNQQTEDEVDSIYNVAQAELKSKIKTALTEIDALLTQVPKQESKIAKTRQAARLVNQNAISNEKNRAETLPQAAAVAWANSNIAQTIEKIAAVTETINSLNSELARINKKLKGAQRIAALDAVGDELAQAYIKIDAANTLLNNVQIFSPAQLVLDLNWPLIRQAIYNKLIKEGFFNLPLELPLHKIPFDWNHNNEFNYWAINLVNRESLEVILQQQTLSEKLETLHRLNEALSINHALMPFLTETLANLIEKDSDLIWNTLFSNLFSTSFTARFVNWIIFLLHKFPSEKLNELIKQPLFENNRLLTLIIRYAKPQLVSIFLEFLTQYVSNETFKELSNIEGDDPILTLASKVSSSVVFRIMEFAQKLNITISTALIDKQFARLNLQINEFKQQAADLIPRLIRVSQAQNYPLPKFFLWEALKYYPKLIVAHIATLSRFEKTKLLTKTFMNGSNVLMITAQFNPEAIKPLLDIINTLNPNVQKSIFTQITIIDKENALMIASRCQTSAIKPLLETIVTLNHMTQTAIFTQEVQLTIKDDLGNTKSLNNTGLNALTITATQHPEAVPTLLKTIDTLNTETQTAIFEQLRKALSLTIKQYPNAVKTLLNVICTLKPTVRTAIIKKIDEDGLNVLMLAARLHHYAIKPLLTAMSTLRNKEQVAILQQTDKSGKNALTTLFIYHPNAIEPLIEHIDKLALSANVKPIIKSVKRVLLEQSITTEQIFMVLTFMKNHDSKTLLTPLEIANFEQKLRPEDWYIIVTKALLPIREIPNITIKKEMVYNHIMAIEDKDQRQEILQSAMNKNTELGQFFRNSQNETFFKNKNLFLKKIDLQLKELNTTSKDKQSSENEVMNQVHTYHFSFV